MTSKEGKILKTIVQQEKRYDMKRLLAEFPNKTFATHNTVKRLQQEIDDTAEQLKKTKSYY